MVDMIILHLKEITLSTKLLVFNTSLLLLGLMWKATYFHSKGGGQIFNRKCGHPAKK